MKRDRRFIIYIILILFFLLTPSSNAQEKINADDAHKYVGQTKTVCGVVASTFYAYGSRGRPTFLNFSKSYPNQVFTIVIWGSDRGKFDQPPETLYQGKRVCVTGVIETYRGKPQIIVYEPSQIYIEK